MKCPNCGKTEFENMPLYKMHCVESWPDQLVHSYVCINCGRVELYMPQELIDERMEQKRIEAERKQAEENRRREEEKLKIRMQELETIIKDENRTLKELKEAQKELTEIQDKLHIRIRTTYFKV